MSTAKMAYFGKIGSTGELVAIAHAMEEEAARRYQAFAQRMRVQGEGPLAELFSFLAEVEAKHAEQVDRRAHDLTGRAPDPTRVRWELPENFDEEAARSATLTPYRALAIAVRNEERAFAFFSYLAAEAASEPLRQLAEEFAKDELEHAARLRHERRKAWRQDKAATEPRADDGRPESLMDLLERAAPMERAAAAAHRSLAAAIRSEPDPAAALLFEQAADDEEAVAAELELRLGRHTDAAKPKIEARSILDGLRLLEVAFELYADVAEHAQDEAVLHEAQRLTERALRRLATVHGSLGSPPA